jgi:hypothetical protein
MESSLSSSNKYNRVLDSKFQQVGIPFGFIYFLENVHVTRSLCVEVAWRRTSGSKVYTDMVLADSVISLAYRAQLTFGLNLRPDPPDSAD